MSFFESFGQRFDSIRRADQGATTYHLTPSERTRRSDLLSSAMGAPEAERRYAVYMSTRW